MSYGEYEKLYKIDVEVIEGKSKDMDEEFIKLYGKNTYLKVETFSKKDDDNTVTMNVPNRGEKIAFRSLFYRLSTSPTLNKMVDEKHSDELKRIYTTDEAIERKIIETEEL